MVLVRFAVSLFALSLLGLALSLSGAHSAQERAPAPVISVTTR